jgi:hypothetical protein
MRYVFHQNKKLYFPRYMRKPEVQDYYNILLMEQDAESPHLYETEKFFVKAGDIIADIGAAEGIWALSNVEKAKKVYIFECEIHWLEALKKTFEPWQDRISIVNKYVSNVSMSSTGGGGGIITIDDFFSDKKIDFIKADIEGNEPFMLQGAKNLLTRNNLCIAICAYHNDADAGIITKILSNTGFALEFSKGYILLQDNNTLCLSPRKGIIRAYKKQL